MKSVINESSDGKISENHLEKRRKYLRRITTTAILAAIASILMLIEFPISFLAPNFYKLDFSELPVLLGGFSMGPLAAVVIELVKVLMNFLLNGTVTAGIGELANFIIGASFTVTASFIYKYHKTRGGAIAGMAFGTLAMAVIGAFVNALILLPAYAVAFNVDVTKLTVFGEKALSIPEFVALCVVPFNLLKGVVTSIITFLVYKRVSGLLHK